MYKKHKFRFEKEVGCEPWTSGILTIFFENASIFCFYSPKQKPSDHFGGFCDVTGVLPCQLQLLITERCMSVSRSNSCCLWVSCVILSHLESPCLVSTIIKKKKACPLRSLSLLNPCSILLLPLLLLYLCLVPIRF